MQNFGKIRTFFNGIFLESFVNKDKSKKEVFKKYLNALKENKVLNTQYLAYKNIEDRIEENEAKASEYIKENIELVKQFKAEEILEANTKLLELAGEINEDALNVSYELEGLHEHISKLIFTEKNVKTIDSIMESMDNVVDYVKNNQAKVVAEKSEPKHTGILANIAVDKFNERYSELTEVEGKILKAIIATDEEVKKNTFNEVKMGAINIINEGLEGASIDQKEKLLKAKETLLALEYSVENFEKNIIKISELY